MPHQQSPPPAVSLRQIVKRFRYCVPNDHVTLEVRDGEIFALLGENGAGKTTLMNILSGYLRPDSGEMALFGQSSALRSPADAIRLGVGMVHQHFMLVPPFTALENIVLGQEPVSGAGFMKLQEARAAISDLMTRFGLDVPLDVAVEKLGVGERQRVEILKALYRKARLLILDEPTAVLTPQEAENLFSVLRDIRAGGATIIFITHKLAEVLALADRIGVMRAGKIVATINAADADKDRLAELIVGKPVAGAAWQAGAPPSHKELFRVKSLSISSDDHGRRALRDVSFSVRAGEIFGIAGVLGNGQRELELILTGALTPDAGEAHLDGAPVPFGSAAQCLQVGIAHVPEDRGRQGLVGLFNIGENLILGSQDSDKFSRAGVLRPSRIRAHARRMIAEFDIRPAQTQTSAKQLSGGNQQKVVVARELQRGARLLIAAHPTRGVDIGATQFIHQCLMQVKERGGGVILISADLDELLRMSDRIGVMFDGRLLEARPASELDERMLGAMMIGGKAK